MTKTGPAITKATVLVVDDEVMVRTMIAEELQYRGYTVIEAVNADEALAVVRSSLHVDLVVTDWRMPGSLDGAALVPIVRSECPHLKLVMVSGQYPDQKVLDALDGYLLKPLNLGELSRRVTELVPTATER